MLRIIEDDGVLDKNWLKLTYYGRKILAYYEAYGLKYDFCKFYEYRSDGNFAIISLYNSNMVICCDFFNSASDIVEFVQFNAPFRFEAPRCFTEKFPTISGYNSLRRTLFELKEPNVKYDLNVNCEPNLDRFYEIIDECFTGLLNYEGWMTDTSHKLRRGISQLFLLDNCSTAAVQFEIDNICFVGHVATLEKYRGKGYARKLLYWLGNYLHKQGKHIELFALEHRTSYYKELGFTELSNEIVYERQKDE